jgi:hypothetical protein
VAHFASAFKLIALALLGVLAAVLVVVLVAILAPFVLVYFLFSRFCDLIEWFRPARKRATTKKKGGGERLAMIQKIITLIPSKSNG